MLYNKMRKMLDKKKGLSDVEKDAKMDVVGALRDHAMEAMKGKMDGIKKVSVASDSKEGLREGLDKAKEMIQEHNKYVGDESPEHDMPFKHEEDSEEESPEHEASESSEEEQSEHDMSPEDQSQEEEMSEDEINQQLQHLMDLKKKLAAKK